MPGMEYTEVELPLLEQLQGLGYTYRKGSELDGERRGRGGIVLEGRLLAAIRKFNPWISEGNAEKVVKQLTAVTAEDLWEANRTLYDWLFGRGLSVMQDLGGGKKHQTVRLFDFDQPEENDFLVANQVVYRNAHGRVIPDIVLYINGLPLVLIECKSPLLKWDQQLPEGVRQFDRYIRTNERLFWYNQLLIVTSRDRARVGTIFARPQHYGLWRDPYPLTVEEVGSTRAQDILVAGILRKDAILDLMRNFIVFDGKAKKVARYQQYRAVQKTVRRIMSGEKPEQRGGVVWHTQGSGKSLTMVFLATKLRREKQLENPMVVVVTDRQDLDDQITKTFQNCGFPNPLQATSVADLKQQLSKGPGTTVLTLIQKFQSKEKEKFPVISEAENIIVMTDESHRSQYKGLAMNMRKALPNATFIAFTGTPIDKKTRSTTKEFGSYIDKYTIEQAVEDGATVQIYYEPRLPNLHVKGDSLDEIFDRVFHELDKEEKEKVKRKYVTDELILTAPERMREIALDLVRHFEQHILVNGYKAQVVAVSREAAVKYKQLIDQYAAGKFETAVIISAGQNDSEEMREYHLTKEQEKELIERFKKPFSEDKLAMLIVCDKLLTGFDAPIEQVMYLDKLLKEHNLLQAIARTNRRYDEKKTYGLIVDYFGISRFLDEALKIFSSNDVQGALQPIDEELPRLEQRHRAVMRFFDGLSEEQREEAVLRLEAEDVRAEFETAYKRFAQSMDKVLPSPKAEPFLADLKRLGVIRQLAKSRFSVDDGMDIADYGEKVREIVYQQLRTDGIEVKEPVPLLHPSFVEEVEQNILPESKAAQIEHAIKREITVRMEEDEVFYTSLKERLEELLARYEERKLDIFELLEQLQKAREEIIQKVEGKTQSGLKPEEEPYYNKLLELLEGQRDREKIKEMAITVHRMIVERVSSIPDWTSKTDFKRKLSADLKIMLIKEKLSMPDAMSLAGYFLDLARVQYG